MNRKDSSPMLSNLDRNRVFVPMKISRPQSSIAVTPMRPLQQDLEVCSEEQRIVNEIH